MMPPHTTYIEGFLGGGAVARHKRLASRNIVLDKSEAAIRVWDYPGWEAHHADFFEWIQDVPLSLSTLIYLDPPYLLDARLSGRLFYEEEMADEASHIRLCQLVRELKCMVMVSHYPHELYSSMLTSWRCETFQAIDRAGRRRTEAVWMNFPESIALHDYRYLGDDFTDRQRIKRKQERWRRRLLTMPAQERYAMLSVFSQPHLCSSTVSFNYADENDYEGLFERIDTAGDAVESGRIAIDDLGGHQ